VSWRSPRCWWCPSTSKVQPLPLRFLTAWPTQSATLQRAREANLSRGSTWQSSKDSSSSRATRSRRVNLSCPLPLISLGLQRKANTSMRIIDGEETKLWLSQRGLLDSTGEPSFSKCFQVIDFAIPVDSGRKTALSRIIVSFLETDDEALLWINEFGIWESSEDRYLFQGFRHSLGESSPLHEKPGHVFSKADRDAVRSLVAMILYFVWGGLLFSPAKGLVIMISHDEFITIYLRDKKDAPIITETLKKFLESGEKGSGVLS